MIAKKIVEVAQWLEALLLNCDCISVQLSSLRAISAEANGGILARSSYSSVYMSNSVE